AGIVHALSIGHVVLPSVPRTYHRRAHQVAFAQWPAAMAAGVIDRIELSTRVEERNLAPAGLDSLASAVGNFIAPCDFHEVCHAPLPPFLRANCIGRGPGDAT